MLGERGVVEPEGFAELVQGLEAVLDEVEPECFGWTLVAVSEEDACGFFDYRGYGLRRAQPIWKSL